MSATPGHKRRNSAAGAAHHAGVATSEKPSQRHKARESSSGDDLEEAAEEFLWPPRGCISQKHCRSDGSGVGGSSFGSRRDSGGGGGGGSSGGGASGSGRDAHENVAPTHPRPPSRHGNGWQNKALDSAVESQPAASPPAHPRVAAGLPLSPSRQQQESRPHARHRESPPSPLQVAPPSLIHDVFSL
ncbi:unnamed protein product, partial [Phaeothamnion confervicola]